MAKGVEVQLYDAAGTLIANATNIEIAWFDTQTVGDLDRVQATYSGLTTDASGWLRLDLSNVTGLALNDWGFLVAYQLDVFDHRQSPVFASKLQITDVTGGVDVFNYAITGTSWARPADWRTVPSTEGQEKFVGLFAVYEAGSNFVALTVSGAYTVDWGDGTVENFAAGATAQRNISYSAAALVGTESTLGYRQALISVYPQAANSITSFSLGARHTSITGFLAYGIANWLDIDLSFPNATSLILSGTSVLVLMTMAEQVRLHNTGTVTNFSSLFSNYYKLQSVPALNTALGTDFSNMFQSCDNLKAVPLLNTAQGTLFNNMFQNCSSLKTVPLLDTSLGTNFSNMFNGCSTLQAVPLLNTAQGTNFSNMFSGCTGLQSIPLLNTALGTNFSSMFFNCTLLQSITFSNTVSGTNFTGMFQSCFSLQTVPLLATSLGTNFSSMFNGCRLLQTIPLLNTGSGTNFSNMFSSCTGLQSIPLLNTGLGADFSQMFASCTTLKAVPMLNTAQGTNFFNMFSGCISLETIPLLDTSLGTNFSQMFINCRSLCTIPLLNTSSGTNFANMFQNAYGLQTIPLLNTAQGTNFLNMFFQCFGLKRAALSGTSKTQINYTNCVLSADELNSIYTNLGTATGTVGANRTITVTGNWGTASDNPAIATAKGWTVTG